MKIKDLIVTIMENDDDDFHLSDEEKENNFENSFEYNGLSGDDDNENRFFNADGIPFDDENTDSSGRRHRPRKDAKKVEFKYGMNLL